METQSEHYGVSDLPLQVEAYLETLGLKSEALEWSALQSLDQFHVRGLAATAEMAELLNPEPGAHILDVGSGLGGPARYLAAVRGCRVTGIDLSEAFVEVAKTLTERTNLADRVDFVQGDALNLPFPDATFDDAWTQHVAMNIADRDRLYSEIYRVLKPGGKLALYDVVTGNGEPLIYPVPWARDPASSFPISEEATRAALTRGGFSKIEWRDVTQEALAWLDAPTIDQTPGLVTVMGPDFRIMGANLARNLKEGRVRLAQAIAQ